MAGAGREDERLFVGQGGAVDAEGPAGGRQVLAAAMAVDFAVCAVPCHIPVATLLHLHFLHAKEGT